MKNLWFKMTILIVPVILISSGLLSMISYKRARDTMAAQMETSYSIAADKYAQELTAWLNSQAKIIDTLATEITLNKLYKEDYETFHQYLAEIFPLLNEDGYMYDIYFTYPDNSMACASDFIPDGSLDYAHEREWFTVAAETGKLFYSTPYKDSDSGYSIITISKAVYEDGVMKGILATDVFVDILINIVSEADTAGNGYAFLIDQNMRMVVHPYEAYAYDDMPPGVMDIPDSPYAEVIDSIESGSKETVYLKDYDGTVRGIAVSRMDNTGWYVGIATDRETLMSGVSGLIRGFLVAAVIAVVIGVGIVIVLARVMSRLSTQLREQENLERMKQIDMKVIRSLASAIDAKDRYTSGHSQRVAKYAQEIARRMGKSEEEQEIVYYSGILHDIGKIRVPVEVINKPGALTEEEFGQIRTHPVIGYHILCDIHEDERVRYGAKYHHERYDGNGYPNGLSGVDIPEIARIIAVADAYDAMASDRSYRKELPQDVVREELKKGRGSQFDPEIADIMLQIMDEDKDYKLRQLEGDILNVLAIDDDRMSLKLLEYILGDMKEVRFIGCTTRLEALETLHSVDIALVLLDLKMPDTDGFTFFREIKDIKDIPVIMMTGKKGIEIIMRIRELGIDDYLTKPLDGAITREAVHGILQRYRSLG